MIIDAEHLILGRLASFAAKKALFGEKIDIINCEKAVITGRKKMVLQKYKKRFEIKSTFKGPFHQRMPDRFVKRAIRGMLPYKKERGRNALKNIMCYIGIPSKLKNEKFENLEKINVLNTKNKDFIYVKDICRILGGKNFE